jgi:hypothetical protein
VGTQWGEISVVFAGRLESLPTVVFQPPALDGKWQASPGGSHTMGAAHAARRAYLRHRHSRLPGTVRVSGVPVSKGMRAAAMYVFRCCIECTPASDVITNCIPDGAISLPRLRRGDDPAVFLPWPWPRRWVRKPERLSPQPLATAVARPCGPPWPCCETAPVTLSLSAQWTC